MRGIEVLAGWRRRYVIDTPTCGTDKMTSEQSRRLKVGDRVCFDGDKADRGTVTATHLRYVIINWDDGHQSFSGHNTDMRRVERVVARKSGK